MTSVNERSTFHRACEGIAWLAFCTGLIYSLVIHRPSDWTRRGGIAGVSVGADTGGGPDAGVGSVGCAQYVGGRPDTEAYGWAE